MCWAQGSNPSPGCAPAHTAQGAVGLLCCCLMCSPPMCCLFTLELSQLSQEPQGMGALLVASWKHHSCPWKGLPCRAYQISWAPSPFRAAAPAATWFGTPSSSKSSPLEPQLCALLLASVPAPRCLDPTISWLWQPRLALMSTFLTSSSLRARPRSP